MTIFDFSNKFRDEKNCADHLREIREHEGISCKNCGISEHRWLEKRQVWECKKCHSRKSLKSGTVMENTNLPILLWFRAIALFSMTKKGVSAKELQRQLGLKRYQPAWEMEHKIRTAMGKRDEDYVLEGDLEIDEAFFKSCEHSKNYENFEQENEPNSENVKKTKRGRGSANQSPVLVMVESKPAEIPKKNSKANKIGHIKMKILEYQDSKTIVPILKQCVNGNSCLHTDGYGAYNEISVFFQDHKVTTIKDKTLINEYFPWIHTIISNAKRLLLGIHHKIGKGYIHLYLNEFCYKFNRRYIREDLEEHLLIACVNCPHRSIYTVRSCG